MPIPEQHSRGRERGVLRSRWSTIAAAAAVLSLSGSASAQPEYDKVAADELFMKGLKKMSDTVSKQMDCSDFVESQRIHPQPGTLFTLATCEERANLLAASVEHFEAYLELFKSMSPEQQEKQKAAGPRDAIAAKKIKELSPAVPELTLTLPPGAPEKTVVRLDGATLHQVRLGVAIRVNPGTHVVSTQTPGRQVFTEQIRINKEEKREVLLKLGGPASSGDEAAKVVVKDGSGSGRTAGIILVTVGVLGVAGGMFAAGAAFGLKSGSDQGEETSSKVSMMTTVAISSGGAGLIAGVIGTYLLLRTPAAATAAPVAWIRPEVTLGSSVITLGARGAW